MHVPCGFLYPLALGHLRQEWSMKVRVEKDGHGQNPRLLVLREATCELCELIVLRLGRPQVFQQLST